MKFGKIFSSVTPIFVTLGLLFHMWKSFDFDIKEEFVNLNNLHYLGLILAPFLVAFQNALIALRWWFVSDAIGIKSKYLHLYFSMSYSSFLNQFLPATLAGDAYRVYFQKKMGINLRHGFYSVLIDRGTGYFALFVLAYLLFLTFGKIDLGVTQSALFFFSFCILIAPLVIRKWSFFLKSKIGALIIDFFSMRLFLRIFSLSLFSHFVSILLFVFTLHAFGVEFDDLVILGALYPLSLIVSLLPFSVGGWGVREGTLVIISSIVGVDTGSIVAASIYLGIVLMVAGVINAMFIFPIQALQSGKVN